MKNKSRAHALILGPIEVSPMARQNLSIPGICFGLWRGVWTGVDETNVADLTRWCLAPTDCQGDPFGFRDWHGRRFYVVWGPGSPWIKILMPEEM